MTPTDSQPKLIIEPIGVIHTDLRVKFDAPPQPANSCEQRSIVELFPGHDFERALQDLSGFNRIWLIWWFHKNDTWRPRVRPPRGDGTRRGVFATRSPHRPNPIGISSVPLLGVSGREIHVGNTDLIDGTPILDIKPYIKSADSFPDATEGWLAEIEAWYATPPNWQVIYTTVATEQLDWLQEKWKVDFITRARTILERDPSPNRTRRITRYNRDGFRMGCGAWRIFFSVKENIVTVTRIARGYPPRLLLGDGYAVPDKEAQIAFGEIWPDIEPTA